MENLFNNFWRWGDPEKKVELSHFPKLKTFLENKFEKKLIPGLSIPPLQIPHPHFSQTQIQNFFPFLKPEQILPDNENRLKYSLGKSYHDIIRFITSQNFSIPDFILFPESENDILRILTEAEKHNIKIVTFSGGSNVVGAFDTEKKYPLCMLNMQRLNRLVDIDEISHTATFETGIFGPQIEKILNEKGFTLGHFPQSFEYSTLGGWLALRSAGQESGLYGKIEDIVLQLKIITPAGIFENADFPRHASGIDFHQLFIGSEGMLGIITEAKLRIRKLPKKYLWKICLFKNFETGANALKEIAQSGIHPAIARLSDTQETQLLSLMSNKKKNAAEKIYQSIFKSYLKSKNLSEPSILMMRFAVNNKSDETAANESQYIAKKFDAVSLPSSVAGNWETTRFSLPYLRDALIENRILIDTFETVTNWKNLIPLYQHIKNTLQKKSDSYLSGGILFCHISHIYETGASLYFTIIAPQKHGEEIKQWNELKTVVSDAIVEKDGAISHHHGIGKDHKHWYLQQLNPNAKKLLQAIKNYLDPRQILNPGKLFDETKN